MSKEKLPSKKNKKTHFNGQRDKAFEHAAQRHNKIQFKQYLRDLKEHSLEEEDEEDSDFEE